MTGPHDGALDSQLETMQTFSMHAERDRSAVVRSVSFRRLATKTQMLVAPEDGALRTRLTHTLEVADLARAAATALGLDVVLAETIALAHDIGHPAFGHAGERALARLVPGGFHHAAHGVRVVTLLEPLGLHADVVDGILKHSKGRSGPVGPRGPHAAARREAHVVRACDLFAYAIHDVEDAVSLGMVRLADLPAEARRVLGEHPGAVREALLAGLVAGSGPACVQVEDTVLAALDLLRAHLYEHLYETGPMAAQTARVLRIVDRLFADYVLDEERVLFVAKRSVSPALSVEARAVDLLASLGDREAIALDAHLHGLALAA